MTESRGAITRGREGLPESFYMAEWLGVCLFIQHTGLLRMGPLDPMSRPLPLLVRRPGPAWWHPHPPRPLEPSPQRGPHCPPWERTCIQVVMGMRAWLSSHLELPGHMPASLVQQTCVQPTAPPNIYAPGAAGVGKVSRGLPVGVWKVSGGLGG